MKIDRFLPFLAVILILSLATYFPATDAGVVSVNNTTTTPLGISSTFTGTSDDISDYSTITVYIDANVNGTLKMQFSNDGTNWDRTKTVTIDTTIADGSVHTLETVAQYFRVVYENGAIAQGHMRLQTIYHQFRSGFLTSSPNQKISEANDVQLARNVNDHYLDVSRGLWGDKDAVHKFAINVSSPATTERDLWAYGATTEGNINYHWLKGDSVVRARAGNSADSVTSTGARTVIVEGLDANWNRASDTIFMNGNTVSDTTDVSFWRINRAYVDESGTYGGANVADIIIETTAGYVVAFIVAGDGQTEQSQYSVPAGYTGYAEDIAVTVEQGTNKESDITFWRRVDADVVAAPFSAPRVWHKMIGVQELGDVQFKSKPSFPPKTDIWATATSGSSASGVTITYDLIIAKNDSPVNPQ